jgi:hypothetical protein
MLKGFLAAAALVALTGAAQAGTLQNGVWTANCPDPGAAPEISGKSAAAYNESGKAAQEWQVKAQAYGQCMSAEAKADSGVIVETTNAKVQTLNNQLQAMNAQSKAALDKLQAQAKKGKSPISAE